MVLDISSIPVHCDLRNLGDFDLRVGVDSPAPALDSEAICQSGLSAGRDGFLLREYDPALSDRRSPAALCLGRAADQDQRGRESLTAL